MTALVFSKRRQQDIEGMGSTESNVVDSMRRREDWKEVRNLEAVGVERIVRGVIKSIVCTKTRWRSPSRMAHP